MQNARKIRAHNRNNFKKILKMMITSKTQKTLFEMQLSVIVLTMICFFISFVDTLKWIRRSSLVMCNFLICERIEKFKHWKSVQIKSLYEIENVSLLAAVCCYSLSIFVYFSPRNITYYLYKTFWLKYQHDMNIGLRSHNRKKWKNVWKSNENNCS